MVCGTCNGSFTGIHNSRTCPLNVDLSVRIANRIANTTCRPTKKVAKKVRKPLEGLAGCQNIFKEPKSFYTTKKVTKPLEGLLGCQNIFKEPKSFYTAKKVTKPLEGLAGCMNIFKEPTIVRKNKGNTKCSLCGETGHNQRTCPMICPPCVNPDTPTKAEMRVVASLAEILC